MVHMPVLGTFVATGLALTVAAVCGLVAATPAHAEKADRNKPIHLEADRVTGLEPTRPGVIPDG